MMRQIPIPATGLLTMTATYKYDTAAKIDRFCWLESGKVLEKNCF
jgi:hypothetical protein